MKVEYKGISGKSMRDFNDELEEATREGWIPKERTYTVAMAGTEMNTYEVYSILLSRTHFDYGEEE